MQQWTNYQWRRSLRYLLGALLTAIVIIFFQANHTPAIDLTTLPASQYASTITAPFNQPDYYPVRQFPPSDLYKPVAEWSGRLILPSAEEYQQFAATNQETDWAWLEVYTAPATHRDWVGQKVRLGWSNAPRAQNYVRLATRDMRFTPEAERDWQNGVINPIRLNNRNQVGPLQSLAGGRPFDDVTVALAGDVVLDGQTLRVDREPLQETGRFYALIKFLEPVPPANPADLPQQCPGAKPCTSDLMRVQHYNPATRQFDGAIETIRIPQQPMDKDGVFNMTTRDLHLSPAGQAGWYIYGAQDQTGLFTVQALKPRSLIQVPAQIPVLNTIVGFNEGARYINFGMWKDVEKRQRTIQTVLADAQKKTPETSIAEWKVGTFGLLMHLYGGRGGDHENSESYILGTYAGHFSFGTAEVVIDPFTAEPIFDVNYYQVFGNGSDGTLSGGQTWANYMGNSRRGFMNTRPVADTLMRLDTLTEPYNFGGTELSFFKELIGELSLVGARYRIGDGSGNSTITSATSCVQDSAQALFISLQRLQSRIQSDPQIVEWMRQNPDDPTTQRFTQLVQLAKGLANQLMPMGIVRWDWQQNANILTGVETEQQFLSIDDFQIRNLLTGLISWRTAMPRQANDELAMLFLHNNASLWFLQSNIIGGNNVEVAPLEPTLLLGAWKVPGTQVPLASWAVIRTFGGFTIPTPRQWLITLLLLAGFGAIALLIGFSKNILQWQPWQAPWYCQLATALRLLIVPALLQEYIFRVLLIPYPKEWYPIWHWWGWALLAIGLFVGFQWVYAKYAGRSYYPFLSKLLPLYLLMGITCAIVYRITGSLWTITVVHWIWITIWQLFLGGRYLTTKEPGSGIGVRI